MKSPAVILCRRAGVLSLAFLLTSSAHAQSALDGTTDLQRMIAILKIPTPPPPRPAGVTENHDESKVAELTNLPDPLKLKNGQMVTTPEMWWNQRRPEIFEDTMREVYGRIPANTPKVTWEVVSTKDNGQIKTKTVVGHIDNAAYPAATPVIRLVVNTPSKATGPVPMIVDLASGTGGPVVDLGPNPQEMAVLNNALKKLLEADDPAAKAVFEKNATYAILGSGVGAPAPAGPATTSPLQQVLALGWGYTTYYTGAVQADSDAGLTQGIIGLMNKGQPRSRPDEWGVLAAWAWGAGKSIDYFETDKDVDAKQIAVEGFSRWGKTAVLCAVIEPRWVLAWAGDSGEGGTKLNRRDYGETVDDVAKNFPWWMAGNFQKYAGHHWDDLPVDAHEMVALVAPRPVFITGGTADQHADAKGMFLAAVGAGPVYKLLGKQDVGTTEMPAADVSLISGDLGYRMHTGIHTPVPDWPVFLQFAGKYLHAPAAK